MAGTILLCSLGARITLVRLKTPKLFARLLSVVEQAATRMSPTGGMATGKITLGQMAAACRQHDQVGDEDVIALRGVLNRIAPDKVIKQKCIDRCYV